LSYLITIKGLPGSSESKNESYSLRLGFASLRRKLVCVIRQGYTWGHQRGVRENQVTRKDHVSHPRDCSKNNTNMINVFTLTNINTKVIESKLSKNFISEVCIKPVALRINRQTRSRSQFQKVCWPLLYTIKR